MMTALSKACIFLILLIHTTNAAPNAYTISYEPSGETIWRSTSDFSPQQSQSYGQIRLGQVMSIEFDFVYEGREEGYTNQFFRIGADAKLGQYSCTGQESHYPSMWLKYAPGAILDIQFSSGDSQCGTKHYLDDYGNLNINAAHHIKISLNNTNVEITITGGGIGKISPYTKSWPRDRTPQSVLGSNVFVWWMGNKFGSAETDYYDPGLGTFSNIVIKTNIFTFAPTVAPSMRPTKNPTITGYIYPTVFPTTYPTQNPTTFQPTAITLNPTKIPTVATLNPTTTPTVIPTITPTMNPTITPTMNPTITPTENPSITPSINPSKNPTINPSKNPSITPTESPTKTTTINPTISPTKNPTETMTITSTANPNINTTITPTVHSTLTINPTVNSTGNQMTASTESTITSTESIITSTEGINGGTESTEIADMTQEDQEGAKTIQDNSFKMVHIVIIVASIVAVLVSCCIVCGLVILYKQKKAENSGPKSPVFGSQKSMFGSDREMATTATSRPERERQRQSDPQIIFEEENSDYMTHTTEATGVQRGETVDTFGGNIGDLINEYENENDPEIPFSPGTGAGVTTIGVMESDDDTYYEDEYYDEVGDEFETYDNGANEMYVDDAYYDEDGFDIETMQ